jgi:hypothetical protein
MLARAGSPASAAISANIPLLVMIGSLLVVSFWAAFRFDASAETVAFYFNVLRGFPELSSD